MKPSTSDEQGTNKRAGCQRATDCRCGQQLDLNARQHCPRCGRTLTRP